METPPGLSPSRIALNICRDEETPWEAFLVKISLWDICSLQSVINMSSFTSL